MGINLVTKYSMTPTTAYSKNRIGNRKPNDNDTMYSWMTADVNIAANAAKLLLLVLDTMSAKTYV